VSVVAGKMTAMMQHKQPMASLRSQSHRRTIAPQALFGKKAGAAVIEKPTKATKATKTVKQA